MPYLIIDAAWYGGNENMLCLGWEAWAKEEHFEVEWFHAYSKYPAGYGINTYDIQMEIIKEMWMDLIHMGFCKKRWLYRYWAKHMGKRRTF